MNDDSAISTLRFPQKLWKIINDCKTGAIKWCIDDKSISLDYQEFQSEYLVVKDSIFKTKNITSFVRQLNLYGFRKTTTHNRDRLCNLRHTNVHEFVHDCFKKDRMDLLYKVSRRHGIDKTKRYHDYFIHSNGNEVSRLQKCHMALTETLQQITEEYRRI